MRPFCLWSFFFLLYFVVFQSAVVSERVFHQRGQHNKLVPKQTNVVNSREKAEDILYRYGYLRCNTIRKRKHHLSKGKHHGHKARHFPKHGLKCTKAEIKEAVRLYQKHYNMPQTGDLDSNTLKMMSASRCGNPDNEVGIPPITTFDTNLNQAAVKTPGKKRSKRSLTMKDIFKRIQEKHLTDISPGMINDTISRRKRWIENYVNKLKSGEIDNKLRDLHDHIQQRRKKRSLDSNTNGQKTPLQETITWRLINDAYSNQLTVYAQRTALAMAFRMWSEVIPRTFYEDIISAVNDVDILIAFGKGEHMNCPNDFDGYGGQLSHAIRQDIGAEIHIDDDEYFTMGSEQGTNLLKVAVHEVGHVLGLIHTQRNYSIMYAIYSEVIPNNNFELGWEDRKLVQAIYGICDGGFDTVYDWVRRRPDGQLIYNTYFFREDHYWMYENRHNRTRYGDPLKIVPEWKGIPARLDGFVHIWTYTQDVMYFFKGKYYWRYNSVEDRADPQYPKLIEKNFRKIPGTDYPNIPSDIDTVFFDKRDGNVYFFKNNLVYGYNVSKGDEGCCLLGYPKPVVKEFPISGDSEPLPHHLDAVYYSYSDKSLYFFKDHHYWTNIAFNPLDRRRTNLVQGPFPIHEKWYDICDVEFF